MHLNFWCIFCESFTRIITSVSIIFGLYKYVDFLYNKALKYFPCPCNFSGCELDIHGFLITSDMYNFRLLGQNGNVDLFKMVFSTQRGFSLSSKCCDWGMANHFKQGFLFLPSSLGLTWLEHGFVLVSSPLVADAPSPNPLLSLLTWNRQQTVRISLISPQETSGNTHARCFIVFENTQRDPKLAPASTLRWCFFTSPLWNSSRLKKNSNHRLMWSISVLLGGQCWIGLILHIPHLLRGPAELTKSSLSVWICQTSVPQSRRNQFRAG